ncbi:hypothetical protein BGW80DRAFT_1371819 [Lactifluus volemus]|nr:hypothetical protein BGW80DRAFT_1371819 [Lactifluus volemus]
MLNDLKFNICKLESSYVANRDVPDLESRIEKYISFYFLFIFFCCSCCNTVQYSTVLNAGVVHQLSETNTISGSTPFKHVPLSHWSQCSASRRHIHGSALAI